VTRSWLYLRSLVLVPTLRNKPNLPKVNYPKLAICIITYDRLPEITRTITALQCHLKYSGEVFYHIADDSSPTGYIDAIHARFPHIPFTHTLGCRGGWGVNANTALALLNKKYLYVFLIEDDYVAKKDINITHGIALMQSNKKVCAVRYDGIAGHILNLRLRETATPIGNIAYMYINKGSSHLNVYSNRPHLRHTVRFACFGKYAEGEPLGETEELFAHKVKDSGDSCMDIAVLAGGIENAFDHIGKSYQGGVMDIEERK